MSDVLASRPPVPSDITTSTCPHHLIARKSGAQQSHFDFSETLPPLPSETGKVVTGLSVWQSLIPYHLTTLPPLYRYNPDVRYRERKGKGGEVGRGGEAGSGVGRLWRMNKGQHSHGF